MSLSFPKIWHLGTPQVDRLYQGPIEITEKVDGCVTPETPILCADLIYRDADQLKIGDKLIAFSNVSRSHKLKQATVTHTGLIKKKTYLITLKDGRTVRASNDHPWLVRDRKHRGTEGLSKRWVNTEDLTEGDKIVALPVWKTDTTWESGWLAGNLDGEGSFINSSGVRVLSYYQAVGNTLSKFISEVRGRGFKLAVDKRRRKANWKVVGSVVFRGGWYEGLRAVGTFRPVRLLEKSRKVWENSRLNGIPDVEVKHISEQSLEIVVALSTSTKTYIANGLFCHNSQFNFGWIDGSLRMRSKGAELLESTQDKLFKPVVDHVSQLFSVMPLPYDGWWFHGETLGKPKHNILEYSRTPVNHFALFAARQPDGTYIKDWGQLKVIADSLAVDTVPLLSHGTWDKLDLDHLKMFLEKESFLGNVPIEGIVIKNYNQELFVGGMLLPLIAAKYVSEVFKEKHNTGWETYQDKLVALMESYRTEARWNKAVQHLRERGELLREPKDIGNLLKEINSDFLEECREEFMIALFKHYWKDQSRILTRGFPEWYKEELVKGTWN